MSESHDPWESARGSQRAEVQAIWANRGAPPPRPPKRRPWRLIAVIVACVVAVVATAALVVVPALQDDGDRDRRAVAAAQERLVAEETARLEREGVPVRAGGPRRRAGESVLAHRARLLTAGERAITANAQARVDAGEIRGPVRATTCRPYPYTDTRAEQEADPGVDGNRYQCTAFSRRFALPELEGEKRTGVIGQPFWLVIDYSAPELTFCKLSPRAGEGGGQALAEVPVDPACQDPL